MYIKKFHNCQKSGPKCWQGLFGLDQHLDPEKYFGSSDDRINPSRKLYFTQSGWVVNLIYVDKIFWEAHTRLLAFYTFFTVRQFTKIRLVTIFNRRYIKKSWII
jgi:hypothetical protein